MDDDTSQLHKFNLQYTTKYWDLKIYIILNFFLRLCRVIWTVLFKITPIAQEPVITKIPLNMCICWQIIIQKIDKERLQIHIRLPRCFTKCWSIVTSLRIHQKTFIFL